jgi:DNA mismatch repair protein MSH4
MHIARHLGLPMLIYFRYYALSAACALFKYVDAQMNTRFAPASLRIKYIPVDGTMMIDPDTARNLELVTNMTHKKSTHSLFGFILSPFDHECRCSLCSS